MRVTHATFINNEIEPGWPILSEHVPLGRRYTVDLDRIRMARMMNLDTFQEKVVTCIWILEPAPAGWLPLEALKIDADA